MEMIGGVSFGTIAATLGTPAIMGLFTKNWDSGQRETWRPLFTALTGAALATVVNFLPIPNRSRIAGYVLVGGGVAAATDFLNKAVVPQIKQALGIADYVQLPYSGYGNQAMVEQGRFQDYVQFGTQAQVEAGEFQGVGAVDDPTGTFAPSF